MTPLDKVLERLPDARRRGDGWSARCPAHSDQNPSLSVSEGENGRALVHCFAGCKPEDICTAMRLTLADLMPDQSTGLVPQQSKPLTRKSRSIAKTFQSSDEAVTELERKLGPCTKRWVYQDDNGNSVGMVLRWDSDHGQKTIRPIARVGDRWMIRAMEKLRPLYRLPDLAKADLVLVVEGEKCVDAAYSLGFTATTSAGGSPAAQAADWQPLAGKTVWILPDHDEPGQKYAQTVTELLSRLSPRPTIKILDLPELSKGDDLVEWIDAHGGLADPDEMRRKIEALAQTAEPLESEDTEDLAYRPFPVAALPQPVRGFVEAGAKAIGCDPSYLALPLLIACAAAVGNTRRLELKRGWEAPPILWGAILGDSGTAKSPAFRLAMHAVLERQRKAMEHHTEELRQHERNVTQYEKAYARWKKQGKNTLEPPPVKPDKPQADRFHVQDTTVEALAPILLTNPRGLLLACDELAGWFGSFDRYTSKSRVGKDGANWLSMFNAESVMVDRKSGDARTIYVPRAAVCVCGGIQPAVFRRALGSEYRESGLAARLLLAYPPRIPKQWTDDDIDPGLQDKLTQLFDKLYDLQPTVGDDGEFCPGLIRLEPEAKQAWITYFNAHAVEQAALAGDLAAAWSKLEEYAARLALVVHCVRVAAGAPDLEQPDILDLASMNAGITLVEWFKHEARRVYTMLAESDAEHGMRRLEDWIRSRGGKVTARQVRQGCRWLKDPGMAEAALDELVKAGRGTWEDFRTTTNGGRPVREFALFPLSTVYETSAKPNGTGGFVDVDSVDARRPATQTPGPNLEAGEGGGL